MPIIWRAVLVVGLVASLAACGDDSTAETAASTSAPGPIDLTEEPTGEAVAGGTLAYGLVAESSGWDPHTAPWALSAYAVANAIYDPLVAYDAEGAIAPYLAEGIDSNEDFTEWTITLRDGVAFHDGTELTAQVVADNLQAAKDSPLIGGSMNLVTSISATDEATVTVAMSEPWSTFPFLLAGQPGYIASPSTMADATGAANPVGTGPFVFDEWVRDSKLTVTANPDYWREGLPYLDGIEFQVVGDPTSRLQSLETGNLDVGIWSSPYGDVKAAAESGSVQMFTDAGRETAELFLAFNTAAPPFDDPIARQAVALAVDREQLAQNLFDGLYEPAVGPINPDSPLHARDVEIPAADLDAARELAEQYEAEHGTPLRFTLKSTPATEYVAVVQAVQEQLVQVGIEAEIETLEQGALIAAVLGGNYEATGFLLFGSAHFDAEYPFIAGDAAPVGQLALNFTRFDDPEVRSLMNEARATNDVNEQALLYAQVEEKIREEVPMVFLVHTRTAFAAATTVHGANETTLPDGRPTAITTAPFAAELWRT